MHKGKSRRVKKGCSGFVMPLLGRDGRFDADENEKEKLPRG